jgi:hypothetical protein
MQFVCSRRGHEAHFWSPKSKISNQKSKIHKAGLSGITRDYAGRTPDFALEMVGRRIARVQSPPRRQYPVSRRISVVAQDCILLYRRLVVGKASERRGTLLTRLASFS